MTSETFPGRAFVMPRINKNHRDNYSRKCVFYSYNVCCVIDLCWRLFR